MGRAVTAARSIVLAWRRPSVEAAVEIIYEAPHPLRPGDRYRIVRNPRGGYHATVPGGKVVAGVDADGHDNERLGIRVANSSRIDPLMWELELIALDSVRDAAFVRHDPRARALLRRISGALQQAGV